MCGQKFGSMKITQEVRDFIAPHREAAVEGAATKVAEFREMGGSVYVAAK